MDIQDFKRQFGLRVQRARRRRQMTQEALAEQIERTADTVSLIERGVASTRIETAFRIAQALDVPVIELFDVSEAEPVDRERRELIGQLMDMVRAEDRETLAAVTAQAEILIKIRRRG